MQLDLQTIRHLYPFNSHYLDMDGQRMHYVDEGSGPVVLLLHGNPTWSFYYREIIKGLRDRYRVIAPDHIGCGLSSKPQIYSYTLRSHIHHLRLLVERLDLKDITLAVHDWGGAIGFGLAVDCPQLFKRFVVFNTAAFLGPIPWRISICKTPFLGGVLVRLMNGFARPAIRMACKKSERMTTDVRAGYLLPYNNYHNRIAIHRFVQDIPIRRAHPTYGLIEHISRQLHRLEKHPTIIFWGLQDFCFNQYFLSEWKKRFPAAQVHTFSDAGHYVVEDAYERILPALMEFLVCSAIVV